MTNPPTHNIRFAFFGTSHIAVMVLDALERGSFLPALVVTLPEKRKGRGMEAQTTPVAMWAAARHIPLSYEWSEFERGAWDVAVIVDYGKILPQRLLEVPEKGFLNVHPSLLPRLRGPSPMRTAILNDEKDTGVSIMLLDEKMDHGPLVAQKKVTLPEWPLRNSELERILLPEAGALLARILPDYVTGEIEPRAQNHDIATYTDKFAKEDGLLDLSDDPYKNLLKIRAFDGWPGTYTFFERGGKKIRVGILDADVINGKLYIHTVKPEGKKEMGYEQFLRSGAKPIS